MTKLDSKVHLNNNLQASHHRLHHYKMIVLAASAGGLEALSELLSALPEDFPVPVAIVQHRTSEKPYLLADLLGRRTKLKVKYADDGERITAGTVYIAPHDEHLCIETGHRFALTDHRKIRHVRPSANPLFTSAAEVFKDKVIAVVLTGGDSDATDGVQSIKGAGGIVIAQNEATSEHFAMPKSAIATGCVDYVLPLKQIGPTIVKLVEAGVDKNNATSSN